MRSGGALASRAALAAAVACLVDAFLPWMRSGSLTRNGYSLLSSAQRAGLVTHAWARVLVVAAYLLPTLVAAALAGGLLAWRRTSQALAGVGGAVLALGSVVVLRDVHHGLRFGVILGLVLGAVTVGLAVVGGGVGRSQVPTPGRISRARSEVAGHVMCERGGR